MRTGGILMHLTSLPSPYGVGTMGACARRFLFPGRRHPRNARGGLPTGGEMWYISMQIDPSFLFGEMGCSQ